MRIPPVDPTTPRRLRKRFLEPIATTSGGRWFTIHVAPRIDGSIGRLTGGRLTSMPGVPNEAEPAVESRRPLGRLAKDEPPRSTPDAHRARHAAPA